jgi:hypothetical protein
MTQAPPIPGCLRWRERRSLLRADAAPIDPRRYGVEVIMEREARPFVEAHHSGDEDQAMTTRLVKARKPLSCWICASSIERGAPAVSAPAYGGDKRERVHAHPACDVVYDALPSHLQADPDYPAICDFLCEALPETQQGPRVFIVEHVEHMVELMERGACDGWSDPDALRDDLPRILARYTEELEP